MAKTPPLKVHILGAGCPQPAALLGRGRYGSGFILQLDDEKILIDAGPGVTHKMGLMNIHPLEIHHFFLTHHHYDHQSDVPCFALTRWDSCTGSEPPLTVFGPAPTKRFFDRLFGEEGAYRDDIIARVKDEVSKALHVRRGGELPRPEPRFDITDVEPGQTPSLVTSTDRWKVTAVQTHHCEPYLTSLAYRFDTDRGSIVFAADCGDCESLRELAKGADAMVIGCVLVGSADLYDNIITGTKNVADIATAAGVKSVILTHTSPGYVNPGVKEESVADIARMYAGDIIFPEEGDTVPIVIG